MRFHSMGLPLTLFGASLHFAEVAYLHEATQARIGQDYVAGTYFFGMGVALMALNNLIRNVPQRGSPHELVTH